MHNLPNINQRIYPSTKQTINQSTNQPTLSANQPVDQSINQLTNSSNQQNKQSTKPDESPINPNTSQPIIQQNKLIKQLQPTNQLTKKPTQLTTTDRSIDQPTN
jgi:hypothetical protein